MVATTLSTFSDRGVLTRARDEWKLRGAEAYGCPIPDAVVLISLRELAAKRTPQ